MKNECWSICGWFAERLPSLGVNDRGEISVSLNPHQYPFSGYFVSPPRVEEHSFVFGGSPYFEGEIVDAFGNATVSGYFENDRKRLVLLKQYRHREDRIHYHFDFVEPTSQEVQGYYQGRYFWDHVDGGVAKCSVTRCPPELWIQDEPPGLRVVG